MKKRKPKTYTPHRHQLIVLESIAEDLQIADRVIEISLVVDANLLAITSSALWRIA